MQSLELRIPPLALAGLFAALDWLAAWAFPGYVHPIPGGNWIAALVAIAGGAICTAGVLEFRRAKTTINPLTPGATSAIVTGGIYRYSRNPMYLGFLLMLAGWAVYLAHPLALAMLPLFVACLNRLQILPEERMLSARFGREFAAYCARTGRWL